MTIFIRVEDGAYPVSEQTIKNLNPNVSFPEIVNARIYEEFGYVPVMEIPRPAVKRYEMAIEGTPVKTVKGFYEQTWVVKQMPFDAILDMDGNVIKTSEQVQSEYLEQWKSELKTQVTSKRYSVEVNGLTLENGVSIKTDRESQAMLSSAYSSLKNDLIQSTEWKAESGWVTVTLESIEPIAIAVAQHVSNCFLKEKLHHEAIDNISTFEQADQYDINWNW